MKIKLPLLGTILGLLLSSVMSTAIACGCTDKNNVDSKKAKIESTAPAQETTKGP